MLSSFKMIRWIILIVILLLVFSSHMSGYSKVTCLSAEETNRFLESDPDGFVSSFNKWDLFARKVSTSQEYLNKISKSGVACNVPKEMTNKADALFRSRGDSAIADIPWVFAMTDGTYEDGYPHTRQNVIFLSGQYDYETLVHEKIHVAQRMNPPNLQKMGYIYVGPRRGIFRLRSNPDLSDDSVWKDHSGKVMVAHYNSDRPLNIGDVDTSPQYEHPYEFMAYNYLYSK